MVKRRLRGHAGWCEGPFRRNPDAAGRGASEVARSTSAARGTRGSHVKQQRTPGDLADAFRRRVRLLRSAASAFDSGDDDQGYVLAVHLRALVHDPDHPHAGKPHAPSLLAQLGEKEPRGGSLGVGAITDGISFSMNAPEPLDNPPEGNPALVGVRQVAWEVDRTLSSQLLDLLPDADAA
jgi:hypothetical protein